jgi:hypothetical protein
MATDHEHGSAMSGPFIFIATNRIKQGKFEKERERVSGLCDFIEANEPQWIAFNEYANDDGTEVGVVQVHPGDAATDPKRLPGSQLGRLVPAEASRSMPVTAVTA